MGMKEEDGDGDAWMMKQTLGDFGEKGGSTH